MNSNAELAAAEQAMAAAMAAAAAHQSWTEADLHAAYTDPGHSYVEAPQTVDDVAVAWSGQSVHPPHVLPGGNPVRSWARPSTWPPSERSSPGDEVVLPVRARPLTTP